MRQEKQKELIWHLIPVLAFVLWGALCVTDNLWYDEAYSAALVRLPFQKMLYITAVDAHSPFYYALLKGVYGLFGKVLGFPVLKLFSLCFMCGYLLLGKYYVRKLFDREIATWFCIFSLLMPIMSVQAGNVRMYAVALFFMTLLGLTAMDVYQKPTKKKWAVLCMAGICTVYCHTFAMLMAFWVFVLFFVAIVIGKRKDLVKGYVLCGAGISVAFSPWLFVTAGQMLLRMKYDTGSVREKATLKSFGWYATEWFSALETPIPAVIVIGVILCALLCGCGFIYIRREKQYALFAGIGALILTIFTGFFISAFVNNCFLGRYVFPGFGILMCMYGAGMKQLRQMCMEKWGKSISRCVAGIVIAAATMGFSMQYISECTLEYDEGRKAYEDFVGGLTDQDVVIFSQTHTSFLSVYHPERSFYINGYKPYKLPFENVTALEDAGALSDVEGRIYYMDFVGNTPVVFEGLTLQEKLKFHYMYYDFVIYESGNLSL